MLVADEKCWSEMEAREGLEFSERWRWEIRVLFYFLTIIIWSYHADLAFAFVYREVLVSSPMPDNAVAKRKAGSVMIRSSYIYLFLVILAFFSDLCL